MQKNIFKIKFQNYWRNIDKNILICFLILFFLGLFFSFSSTSSLAGERLNKDYYFFFTKHFIFMTFSVFIMIIISYLELDILKKTIFPLFVLFVFLLILVPLIGVEVKGAKRWLSFYLFRIQPIEFVKPLFVLIASLILSKKKIKNQNLTFFFSFLLLSLISIFLISQPDFGQTFLLSITWLALVFVSGINPIIIFFLIFIISFTFAALIYILPSKFGYILNRISTYLDPTKGDNFQTDKALEAIKLGGLKGQGMGEGILKERVPEAHTDYIIAVITEEFGSVTSIMIVLIFLYIVFRVVKICLKENDDEIKISLCGLSSILIFQIFIHIGVNTSLLPTTGMTLPFLSYGGSSLIGSAILAGFILNYTKNRVD